MPLINNLDPNRQPFTTQSTIQHAASTSYTPTTILPTYPAYTNTGCTPSTTATPLNPLSDLSITQICIWTTGIRRGGCGSDALLNDRRDPGTNTTCTTATTSSTPARYYGTSSVTTTTANPDASANANTVTVPTVTKIPVRVPLQALRTVLLLLNKEKGLDTSGVEFSAPACSTVHPNLKVETAGSSQEEEGDTMNGDYSAGSSPAKRGVKRKRKGKGGGKVGRSKKVEVTPPPPTAVTPSTTTVPPVNTILGGEDMTVAVNNAAIPVFPFRPRQRRTMGPTKRRMEMERPSRTGRKTRTGNDESGMWTYRWDRAFRRLISEMGGVVWKVYVGWTLDVP